MGSYRPHAIFAPKKGVLADLGFRLSFYIFCYSGQLRPTLYLTGWQLGAMSQGSFLFTFLIILCIIFLIATFVMAELDNRIVNKHYDEEDDE